MTQDRSSEHMGNANSSPALRSHASFTLPQQPGDDSKLEFEVHPPDFAPAQVIADKLAELSSTRELQEESLRMLLLGECPGGVPGIDPDCDVSDLIDEEPIVPPANASEIVRSYELGMLVDPHHSYMNYAGQAGRDWQPGFTFGARQGDGVVSVQSLPLPTGTTGNVDDDAAEAQRMFELGEWPGVGTVFTEDLSIPHGVFPQSASRP